MTLLYLIIMCFTRKKNKIRKNLYLKILKYINSKSEFTLNQLYSDLKLCQIEKNLVSEKLLHQANIFFHTDKKDHDNDIFTISLDGSLKLVELQMLQKTKALSVWTIVLVIVGIITILVGVMSIVITIMSPFAVSDFNVLLELFH